METTVEKPRLAAKNATPEERRAAAAMMGSARTEKKAAASRANQAKRTPGKFGGPKPKNIFLLPCKEPCTAGESLEGHRWECPRGQAIRRRQRLGFDVITGIKLSAESPS